MGFNDDQYDPVLKQPTIAQSSDAEWRAYYEKQSRELRKENAAIAARLAEFEEHERQTHEILGRYLGCDDSLEAGAKRLRLAVENCFFLAVRMMRKKGEQLTDKAGWEHIVRFCKDAGVQSILRW